MRKQNALLGLALLATFSFSGIKDLQRGVPFYQIIRNNVENILPIHDLIGRVVPIEDLLSSPTRYFAQPITTCGMPYFHRYPVGGGGHPLTDGKGSLLLGHLTAPEGVEEGAFYVKMAQGTIPRPMKVFLPDYVFGTTPSGPHEVCVNGIVSGTMERGRGVKLDVTLGNASLKQE